MWNYSMKQRNLQNSVILARQCDGEPETTLQSGLHQAHREATLADVIGKTHQAFHGHVADHPGQSGLRSQVHARRHATQVSVVDKYF